MLTLRHWSTTLVAALFAALFGLMLIYPGEGWKAAMEGVSIWWDILFPALFPFFVISELMLGFGIVHFFGTLLDPLMRPLFRVPGIGGFVLAMGFASGYPVGARLTSQLWDQRLVTRDEGERLVAFTTSSDPIFLIGAVSVGFFHDVSLAVILGVAHYGASLVIGFLMRFHGSRQSFVAPLQPLKGKAGPGLTWRALAAMHQARIRDGRAFGIMLTDAVQSSLRLILVVGGLVVFFCVILEMMSITHVMSRLADAIAWLLRGVGLPRELAQPFINGLAEVTLGARSAADAGAHVLLPHKVAAAAFILSWGGLCVHAQIVSLLNRTNLRYGPFVASRAIHAILATLLVYMLWTPLQPLRHTMLNVSVSLGFPVGAEKVAGHVAGDTVNQAAGISGDLVGGQELAGELAPWFIASPLVLPWVLLLALLVIGLLYAVVRPVFRGVSRMLGPPER